ncbi:hypothetical protein K431DRAFT_76880 [Polychaeton citri CBS 116435]|uniref:Uncharacterized protein n=1 Tax=Polychaeton citri CBS 116435 TaxID=1314669 RepID=A0A9P4Q7D4_9PEZI|nr:hypothetical protein K431DRAFT_76880 [Polychaeton citri CBS 116435]
MIIGERTESLLDVMSSKNHDSSSSIRATQQEHRFMVPSPNSQITIPRSPSPSPSAIQAHLCTLEDNFRSLHRTLHSLQQTTLDATHSGTAASRSPPESYNPRDLVEAINTPLPLYGFDRAPIIVHPVIHAAIEEGFDAPSTPSRGPTPLPVKKDEGDISKRVTGGNMDSFLEEVSKRVKSLVDEIARLRMIAASRGVNANGTFSANGSKVDHNGDIDIILSIKPSRVTRSSSSQERGEAPMTPDRDQENRCETTQSPQSQHDRDLLRPTFLRVPSCSDIIRRGRSRTARVGRSGTYEFSLLTNAGGNSECSLEQGTISPLTVHNGVLAKKTVPRRLSL